ncbi:SPOR domain-containing protein [Ancylobacter lacus]|uniref:SPOR domain-containing protein n=1 Tax=Ancylobacter lacus TaxID=2579970 RepID=UPI001BCAAADF|nr:SPOR domain-containing protein [Ancylobacter lacus]MBS7540357.1 SPOR domain-containing protein [Ancylobacter lacus]
MVDESRVRFRQDEAHPQPTPERTAADERLAELARLIAQDDPFADLMPGGAPPAPPRRDPRAAAPPRPPEPRAPEPRPADPRYAEPRAPQPPEPRGYAPRAPEPRAPEPRYADPRYTDPRPSDPRAAEPRPVAPPPRGPASRPADPYAQSTPSRPPREMPPSSPGSLSAYARDVYADPARAPEPYPNQPHSHAIADQARDLSRGFARAPQRPADPYADPARRPAGAPPAPGYPQPPAQERARGALSAAEAAVAAALGQSLDFDALESPVPPPRSAPQGQPRPPEQRAPAPQPRSDYRAPEARAPEPRPQPPRAPEPWPAEGRGHDPRSERLNDPRAERAHDPRSERLPLSRAEPAAPIRERVAIPPAPPAAPAARQPVAPPPQPPRPAAEEAHPVAYDEDRSAEAEDMYEEDEGAYEYEAEYEAADEEQRARKRRRLAVVTVLVLLATAGVSGFYFYRHMGGGSASHVASSDGQPPVIRADDQPNKMTPEKQAGGADSQKIIYDRVGGDAAGGTERVVPREEQPVDVSQAAQPRNVTSGYPTPSAPAPTGAMPAEGTAPGTAAGATEPKRVRTLTVRADGSVVESPSAAPAPAGGPMPDSPAATPAPTDAAPIAYSSPTPVEAPAANVPLPPTRTAATPPANLAQAPAAGAAANGAAAGLSTASGFFVQIAAGRSQAEAQAAWKTAQGKYPTVLGSYASSVRRVDLGDRGIFFRAQVGPFASRDQAANLCQNLRNQGGDCMVQKY